MQKGQAVILVLVGILVLAAVAGGAYYLGQQNSSQPENKPVILENQKTPTPPSVKDEDETVDWKTYTNSENGFLVKYPNDWTVNIVAGVPVNVFNIIFARERLPEALDENDLKRIKYSIEVWIDKEGKTLEDVVKENDAFKARSGYKREEVVFNNLPAYKITNTGFDFPRDRIVVAKGNSVYSISLNYLLNEEAIKQEAQTLFGQILSTFKILDQSSAGEKSYPSELQDYPIYPNAQFIKKENNSYIFSSTDTFDEVAGWYSKDKSGLGWKQIGGSGAEGGGTAEYKNGQRYFLLNLQGGLGGNVTDIDLTPESKPSF